MSTNACGGQGLTSEVFLNHSSPCKPLQWGLLLNLEVTNGELGRLARSGDSLSLASWVVGLQAGHHGLLALKWVLGIETCKASSLPSRLPPSPFHGDISMHANLPPCPPGTRFFTGVFLSFCCSAFWKTLHFTSSPHFPGIPLPLASPPLSHLRLTLLCYCSAHLFSSPLSTPLCVLTQSGGSRTAFLEKRIQGLGKCISEKDRLYKN